MKRQGKQHLFQPMFIVAGAGGLISRGSRSRPPTLHWPVSVAGTGAQLLVIAPPSPLTNWHRTLMVAATKHHQRGRDYITITRQNDN